MPRPSSASAAAPQDFNPTDPNDFQCLGDAIAGVAPAPVPGEIGQPIQFLLDAILASGEQGGAPVTIARQAESGTQTNSQVRLWQQVTGPYL